MGANIAKLNEKEYIQETLGDHEDAVTCMTISNDSSIMLTGSEDKTARIWALSQGETECVGLLRGHEDFVTAVLIIENIEENSGVVRSFAVTGSSDCTIRKWDMATCECLHVFEGHDQKINKLMFSGELLFSTSNDHTAKAWVFHDRYLSKLDPENPEAACLRTFKGHDRPVYPMVFLPGEEFHEENKISTKDILITGSTDNTAKSWSIVFGEEINSFEGAHTQPVSVMAVDSTGEKLFTAGADFYIVKWDIETATKEMVLHGHKNQILNILVVNRLMYTASADFTVRCWVTNFGECVKVYRGHKDSVICMKFHDGALFTGCADTCLRAYDARSGEMRRLFKAHTGTVNCMCIANGRMYSGSNDGTVRVWNANLLSDDNDSSSSDSDSSSDEEEVAVVAAATVVDIPDRPVDDEPDMEAQTVETCDETKPPESPQEELTVQQSPPDNTNKLDSVDEELAAMEAQAA